MFWPDAFRVEPLIPLWRQCIIASSWQQGIVMKLSSCTRERKQKRLTLHNVPWMLRALSGNADESHQSKHSAGSDTLWTSHHLTNGGVHALAGHGQMELRPLRRASYYAPSLSFCLFRGAAILWHWRFDWSFLVMGDDSKRLQHTDASQLSDHEACWRKMWEGGI